MSDNVRSGQGQVSPGQLMLKSDMGSDMFKIRSSQSQVRSGQVRAGQVQVWVQSSQVKDRSGQVRSVQIR